MAILVIIKFSILIIHVSGQSKIYDAFNEIYRMSTSDPHEGLIVDEKIIQSHYDFIVVGGGSGGSVVTNRLTENLNWEVLLIEAGGDETFLSDIPLVTPLHFLTSLNWGYKTNPIPTACLALKNGECPWPRGRVLGGSSVINFMVYTRGNKMDYNKWEALGNTGWSYNDVLPYFKKSENVKIPYNDGSKYRGFNGYLNVEESPYTSKMHDAFKAAASEMGYKYHDINGKTNLGFSKIQATIRDGRRCSASRAFLEPIKNRKNFHVTKKSRVTKILIDPLTKRAYGVQFVKNRRKYIVKAKKEVILCAGSIESAHLLMLSGVGPRENLEEHGIPVIKDTMVGYNLQDHIYLNGLVFLINESYALNARTLINPSFAIDYLVKRKGPLTIAGGAEGIAYVKSRYSENLHDDYPDVEIIMGVTGINGGTSFISSEFLGITQENYRKMYGDIINADSFALGPVVLQPRSRGRISLKSANPYHWPKMDPGYLTDPRDVEMLVEAIKLAIVLSKTSGFKKFNATLYQKPFLGCESYTFGSDDYWKCCIRRYATSVDHQVGTAKMGPVTDPTAVVDPRLKVIGINGLRVIDASIMPTIPTCHTNAVVYMIGEKGSDMIKEDWGCRFDRSCNYNCTFVC